MPEISVVVPVYNAAAFLDECVRSVLGQTFRDFELILVDDGSTDSSPAICDRYASQDGRVRVVHIPNGGVSAARNHGLELATGRFVQFVDSDDYIASGMLAEMHRVAVEDDCDVVVCGVRRTTGNRESITSPAKRLCATTDDFAEVAPGLACSSLLHHPVNKLMSSSLIRETGATFPVEMSIGEDLMFCLQFLRGCRRFGIMDQAFYNYRIHSGESLSFKLHAGGGEAFRQHFRALTEFFDHLGVQGDRRRTASKRLAFDAYRHTALTFSRFGASGAKAQLDAFLADPLCRSAISSEGKRNLRAAALMTRNVQLIAMLFRSEMALKAMVGW